MAKKQQLSVDPTSEIPGTLEQTANDGPYLGEPMPMPEPEGGWPADEFTGVGGSYVRDPVTGLRSRVEPAAQ